MIEDVASLGYLRKEWVTLDPTYGRGTWWKRWQPDELHISDLYFPPDEYGNHPVRADFRDLPWPDDHFDAVAFDPPYKLNGTPDEKADPRYGVGVPVRWQDRMQVIAEGAAECARVLRPGGYLLVKVQDQVCSGRVRWQTLDVWMTLADLDLELVDRFIYLRDHARPQPPGRRQVHAAANFSTLLIFRK